MRNLVRNAATVAAAVALAVSVAPAASAAAAHGGDAEREDITNINVGNGDAEFNNGDADVAAEFGPGNLAANWIKYSKNLRLAAQNEEIRTRDIDNSATGKGNSSTLELEGSEQDQNEAR